MTGNWSKKAECHEKRIKHCSYINLRDLGFTLQAMQSNEIWEREGTI